MKWILVAVAVVAVVGGLIYASQRDDGSVSDGPPSITWEVITSDLVDLGLDRAFQVDGDPHGVFLASVEDRLYEVDRGGVITWALRASAPIGGCFWASDSRIGFWVEGNGLYVVDRSGDVMWKCMDEHLLCAAPSAWDDVTRAVVGTDNGLVYGTYRGSVEWEADLGSSGEGKEKVLWISTEEGRHVALVEERNDAVLVYPDGTVGEQWSSLPFGTSMVDLMPSGGILVCCPETVVELKPDGVVMWEYSGVELVQCHRLPTGSTMMVDSMGEITAIAPNEYPMWRAQADNVSCVRWSLNGGAM